MNIKQLIISTVVFLLIDAVYLSSLSSFFNQAVNRVQGSPLKFNVLGAIGCYIALILGLNYFILDKKASITDAFLFGLVIYAVFETTTYAMFKNWPASAVFIDTLWGGILFALSTYVTRFLLRRV